MGKLYDSHFQVLKLEAKEKEFDQVFNKWILILPQD
ncbi:MAG: hypothetical protein Sylvanvirus7_14 [Sylvanvirus sp.]|uniref:Uncharacterized protein n=1 Tax=Sylvanvirus sp. TaxID=2487774 RepID=A0A3G5AHS6_9VIRU|nr:MAG: hypothetical protein Sylvanvirus7_14 [Sylvanvirus sp.]